MTKPASIDLHIERLVLEGVALAPAEIDAVRDTIVATLSTWFDGVDADSLRAGSLAQVRVAPMVFAGEPDGRQLGAGIAAAIRTAVLPSAGGAS